MNLKTRIKNKIKLLKANKEYTQRTKNNEERGWKNSALYDDKKIWKKHPNHVMTDKGKFEWKKFRSFPSVGNSMFFQWKFKGTKKKPMKII